MFRSCLMCLVLIQIASVGFAASREWHDQLGNSIRAEFTGVVDGQVVLKSGSKRQRLTLAKFSLDDREFIVDRLKKRKQFQKIAELLPAAGAARFSPSSNRWSPMSSMLSSIPVADEPEPVHRFYGLKLPSPPLLEPALARQWTDLLNNRVTATFEQLVAPASVRLRDSGGRTQEFPLVNLVRADIEYLRATIRADWERDVFPPEFQPMTDEQLVEGYRTWTDRTGNLLDAGFVRRSGSEVTLEANGTELTVPLHAISLADRNWITDELARRDAEAKAAAAAARVAGQQRNQNNPMNSSGGRTNGLDSTYGGSGFSKSPRVGFGSETFRFRCRECGHTWTKENGWLSHCPKCSGQIRGQNDPMGSNGNLPGPSGNMQFGPRQSAAYQLGRVIGTGALLALIVFGIRKLFF